MNTLASRFASVLLGSLAALAAVPPAAADDTEIFVATSNPLLTGAQPNILFIYDNSGSMDSKVLTQQNWDPDVTFTGCYQPNALYFSTTGTTPACGSSSYVNASANNCAASVTPLRTIGAFSDRMLAWRDRNFGTDAWEALNSSARSRPLECQDDRGVHGGNSGGASDVYAANGATGPWDPNSNNEPNFNTDYTIWSGNWLNWSTSGGMVEKTRMEIVHEVTINLLDSLNSVNVGLMHFNYEQGGTVAHAIEDIATSRTSMKTAVNALAPETWTPLSEVMYEAANYYMGRNVDYGNVGPVRSVGPSRTSGTVWGATYKRPATLACQKNYIVYLTDGQPTRDLGATGKIEALPDFAANVTDPTCSGAAGSDGECLPDLAEYLYRHDLDGSLAGLQNVTTYTVGFGVDLLIGDTKFLEKTAELGGGKYFPATDTSTLQAALTSIVLDILDDASTYSTPTAPVNAFNRTENLSEVFVSVFAPSINRHWPGNLKKYRFSGGQLVDQDNVAAVDPATGFFKTTSRSFWSDEVDGDRVPKGGAANELPVHTARTLYTDVSGGDLTAADNAVTTVNSSLTAALIGAPPADRDAVINWARGLDLTDDDDDGDSTDIRHVMGDPLHVPPAVVIYGGTEAAPDATVYVATNDGYVHAFNPDDGSELWSYVPSEMLDRLYGLYLNETTTSRSYGLDGELRVYIDNNDYLPGVDVAGGERVILYFGMRRGGDTVYALEVTDRSKPKLLWKVNSADTGFENLGQTWSTPSIVKVDIGGTERKVAIFGGGYDDGQDLVGYRADARGNAIYMVDAFTGELLWSAGNGSNHDLNLAAMEHSIPAAIKVIDLDLDGHADRMYAADMGGRVWRFDIFNGETGADLVQGGVLASLGAADLGPTPPVADVRRFYATPDVAQVVSHKRVFLSVSLGSGHREHPLDTGTNEEFYSLRDYNVFKQLTNDQYGAPITRSDLTDITSDTSPELPYDSLGWRLTLDQSPGEKVGSESITFQNSVFFTSFSPGGSGDACVAAGGLNRLYHISVLDGAPRTNQDGSTEPQPEDRYYTLAQGGFAPEPVIFFFNDDGGGSGNGGGPETPICVAGECPPVQLTNPPVRTRWNQDGAE